MQIEIDRYETKLFFCQADENMKRNLISRVDCSLFKLKRYLHLYILTLL